MAKKLETVSVVLKDSSIKDTITINADSFNPDIHKKVMRKKVVEEDSAEGEEEAPKKKGGKK